MSADHQNHDAPTVPADGLEVRRDGNVLSVGPNLQAGLSGNVLRPDEVQPTVTYSEHVIGQDAHVEIMDKSDPFDDSLRRLARERDYALERLAQCVDANGNVKPGMEGDADRWHLNLQGIENSINYQVGATERGRAARYQQQVGFVERLAEDEKAIDARLSALTIAARRQERGY